MNLQLIAAVAIGGALGSVARYLAGIGIGRIVGLGFPWGTLIINIAGSFLIGLFIELFALRLNLSQPLRVLITVGFCGGFTTFSTFSLESWLLVERGQMGEAMFYIIAALFRRLRRLNVGLSVMALFAALQLVRSLA